MLRRARARPPPRRSAHGHARARAVRDLPPRRAQSSRLMQRLPERRRRRTRARRRRRSRSSRSPSRMLTVELEARPLAAARFRGRRWEVGHAAARERPAHRPRRASAAIAIFRIFSGEDLHILAGVASGASVALENARLSRELRRSETALERANRLSSIGTLAAGIAHEIRNPLTAVKTFLDLLPHAHRRPRVHRRASASSA